MWSRPRRWCSRLIAALAEVPKTGRGAIALIALFSMLTSLISWGLSLIFSGLLAREMARRVKGMDYRAAGAAAYLGLGAVWALGLSSSAAMLMATKSAIPPRCSPSAASSHCARHCSCGRASSMAAVLIVVSVIGCVLLRAFGRERPHRRAVRHRRSKPLPAGRRAAHQARRVAGIQPAADSSSLPRCWSGISSIFFRTSPQGALAALDLNTYNLMFITAGLLLHWRPQRFVRAVADAVPATGGVLIQFPFYAVIFGMIVGTGISDVAGRPVRARHHARHLSAAGCALFGRARDVFVPSGGSKWIIEAPYVLQAANQHQVHLGWVVQIYNAAEALPNLINPFWMLPLLGILKLKARDLVGYTVLQMLLHIPIVFFLCWFFARYIAWVPPVH